MVAVGRRHDGVHSQLVFFAMIFRLQSKFSEHAESFQIILSRKKSLISSPRTRFAFPEDKLFSS